MRILIVGLGSIGRRHLTCLSEMLNVKVASLRTTKGALKKSENVIEFTSLDTAFEFKPDGVIVANPTSLHIESAEPFLKRGIKTLIEKPIGFSSTDANPLKKYSSLVRVAYCYRFHEINRLVSKIYSEEKIFKVSFRRSYYLPKWHPYADYRTEYTAQKKMGGGVIRTLSHEIDLMIHWFGVPDAITGVIDKISDLEIDTDDCAFFSCRYHKKKMRVNFDLDFFSPVNVNIGEIYSSKGKYQWDTNRFKFTAYDEEKSSTNILFEVNNINQMYSRQMMDFVKFVESGESQNANLEQSIEVLKVIEKIDGK